MIPKQKCDVCRRRKIKCDEAKPTCSACRKKGRPCSYTDQSYVDPSSGLIKIKPARLQHGGLRLVGTQESEDGASFQTWALQALPTSYSKPERLLSCPSSKLADRWIRTLEVASSRDSSFELYDVFLGSVPVRIGSSPAIDAAVDYSIACWRDYLSRDTDGTNTSDSLGIKAVSTLRRTLATVSTNNEDHILVSMMLHVVAEYLKGGGRPGYMHVKAMCELLKVRKSTGRWTSIDRAVLPAIVAEAVGHALLFGESSQLDDSSFLSMLHLSDLSSSNPTYFDLMVQVIKWPRLVSLVRCYEHQTRDNDMLKDNIISCAEELYDFRLEPESTSTRRGLPPQYRTYRLQLCGIIQRMRELGIASRVDFDYASVEREEEEIAGTVSRMYEGFDPRCDPPWKGIRLSAFTTLAYGAWSRIERRRTQEMAPLQDRNFATDMKHLCVQLHSRAFGTSSDMYTTEMKLEQVSNMLMGGPPISVSLLNPPPLSRGSRVDSVADVEVND